MKNIVLTKKIVNERLGNIEVNVHSVVQPLQVNFAKGTIQGMVQSFKNNVLSDCIGENGAPQPLIAVQFNMKDVDFTNMEKAINDYLNENLEKLVSA